ncbi:ABC transporter permease [Phytoactinopolyspora limicola]|uniref:ABC transporter permease n=1 Tax=Phytoactinopolyspora limicola TaxID=2715536 RepID=UPI001A9C2DB2|nr:ABC transporter permease [Phytoactinopolyspora limicola]
MPSQPTVDEPTGAVRQWLRGRARMPLLRTLRHDRIGIAGAVIVATIIGAAALAPWLAPYDPTAMSSHRLAAPGGIFPLGSDEAGRDLLSRVLYGARTSIQVSVVVVTLASLIGVTLGLLAGFYRGVLDGVIMRIMDMIFAFPTLLLALAVVAALGPDTRNLIIALTVVFVPSFARVTRGAVLSISKEPYVEAARSAGLRDRRIILKYILPNSMAPIAVQFTISLAYAILVEASLGYLGLGVPPPAPSWGSMLSTGKAFMEISVWPSLVPGICIMITVLGFNLLGDALRDSLDPRLRSRVMR